MTTEDDKRAHLTRAMEDRRVELRMSWDEVARGAGISVAHLRRIRSGAAALTPMVARGIEDALQWTAGSVARVLEGGEPGIVHYGSVTMSASGVLAAAAEAAPAAPIELPRKLDLSSIPERERHLWMTPDTTVWQRRVLIATLRALRQQEAEASWESNGTD